jgi:pantothenate kinase type III
MTDGMLERLEAEFGLKDRLSVILTGVSSQPVASHMTHKVRVEQTLTAIGLLRILELNTKTR